MGIFKFEFEKMKYEKLFDKVVYPLIESHTGLKCEDARRYYEPSSVKMDLIAAMIKDATLVLVEISEVNPNVFLNLGLLTACINPQSFCARNRHSTQISLYRNKTQ